MFRLSQTTHRRAGFVLAAAACTALAPAAILRADEPEMPSAREIKLEGRGDRRGALDAIQGKPFDVSLLADLKSWSGNPVTAETIKDKVLVIVTWASWYKTSFGGLSAAQELYAEHAKDGLVVVGVHDARGFERAADIASEHGVKFPYALDEAGRVKAGLMVDVNPDFFLIDRAGRLRFADVATSSVGQAAAVLLAETPEEAANAPAGVPKPEATQGAEGSRSRTTAGGVSFELPDPAAYGAVKWPDVSKRVQYARDLQGKRLPAELGGEEYVSDRPDMAGKILVIDFWATWCPPCRKAMPGLDKLYSQNKADVVVLGMSDEDKSTVKSFLAKNQHEYPQAVDTSKKLYSAMGIQAIPHVIVVSTDGVIRWQGNPAGEMPALNRAVLSMVKVDPGVQARRTAEAEALKK